MYLEKPKLHNLEDYLLATFFFKFVRPMYGRYHVLNHFGSGVSILTVIP